MENISLMTKKIFFWLGNDYTHYSLAYALQKEYDHKLFAIIEVTEKAFDDFADSKMDKETNKKLLGI
mgnify:CR=1 FL=1